MALMLAIGLVRIAEPAREAMTALRLIRRAAGGAALAVREAMQVLQVGDGDGRTKDAAK